MNFFYVQDDWKVSKKLTLNLGVRYEYATPQWEDGNHLANFVPGSPAKMITATSGSISNRALVHPDRNNWAPRVGLAYTLTPKTVIRSGYGISYIHFNRAGGENLLAYNPPSVITININNPNPQTSPTCGDRRRQLQLLPPHGVGLYGEYSGSDPHRLYQRLAALHAAQTRARAMCRAGISPSSSSWPRICSSKWPMWATTA